MAGINTLVLADLLPEFPLAVGHVLGVAALVAGILCLAPCNRRGHARAHRKAHFCARVLDQVIDGHPGSGMNAVDDEMHMRMLRVVVRNEEHLMVLPAHVPKEGIPGLGHVLAGSAAARATTRAKRS